MLVGKRECLDLQEVWVPQQSIQMNAQGVCSQLGIEAGTQPPEAMGMIDFDVKLLGQLPIHRLNDLPERVEHLLGGPRLLSFLVAARQGEQAHPLVLPEFGGFGGTDVAFVAYHLQVGMLAEQLKADFQVAGVGGRQLEV